MEGFRVALGELRTLEEGIRRVEEAFGRHEKGIRKVFGRS